MSPAMSGNERCRLGSDQVAESWRREHHDTDEEQDETGSRDDAAHPLHENVLSAVRVEVCRRAIFGCESVPT